MGHRAIRQIGCPIQKSLISVISFGELTKIGDSNALTFFSEIKAKIALPEVKTFFFNFGDQGKNRSPRCEDLYLEIRAITGHTALTRKQRHFFSRLRATELWSNSSGPQSNGPCELSNNTKWATVPKRFRSTEQVIRCYVIGKHT